MSALNLLKQLGVELSPRSTLLIYGPPMAGKTALALLIARELKLPTKLLALELSWRENDYCSFIKKYAPEKMDVVYPEDVKSIFHALRSVQKPSTIIVDSLSVLADYVSSRLTTAIGYDILPLVARISPLMRVVAYEVKKTCIHTNSVGLMVAQAGGGPEAYRGISSLRPSIAQRVGHYCTYIVLLETCKDVKKLTLVASRVRPWLEGRCIEFKFRELVEKGGATLPSKLPGKPIGGNKEATVLHSKAVKGN